MCNDLIFYKNYFGERIDIATKNKIEKLKTVIKEDTIYKFILFDKNSILNEEKLHLLKDDMLWFSHYIYLNDVTEFEIKYDAEKVAAELHQPKESICCVIAMLKEIYDVCSFTYEYDDSMWENYSNNGNGLCLKFKVNDYDMLFPVDYISKKNINYSKMIIDAFKKINGGDIFAYSEPLALLPYVTKNPRNGKLDSTKEKEVRILYSPFDDGEVNGGMIYPNVKENKGYKGTEVSYDYCKLTLEEIIVGNDCPKYIASQIESIAYNKNIVCWKRKDFNI